MVLSAERIREILSAVKGVFPSARRFSAYAGGAGLMGKSLSDLSRLHGIGLNTLYLGLESGDEETLRAVGKGCTAAEMVAGVTRAQTSGIRVSAIVLLGLAGKPGSRRHAERTAEVLNMMQPRILNFLTLMLVPGTELHKAASDGTFHPLEPQETLRELHGIISALSMKGTVVRANHASTFLPLEGTLPRDRDRLLTEIEDSLSGRVPLVPDFLRGL